MIIRYWTVCSIWDLASSSFTYMILIDVASQMVNIRLNNSWDGLLTCLPKQSDPNDNRGLLHWRGWFWPLLPTVRIGKLSIISNPNYVPIYQSLLIFSNAENFSWTCHTNQVLFCGSSVPPKIMKRLHEGDDSVNLRRWGSGMPGCKNLAPNFAFLADWNFIMFDPIQPQGAHQLQMGF